MRISLAGPGCFLAMASTFARACEADPDGLGRSHVVVKGIEDIDTSQLVAISLEDSLDGQPTHFETEPGVLLNQIARCATERARVSAPRLCKLKREIEAAGVFRRGKPPAGFAARCG